MAFLICMQLLKIIHWSVKITLEQLGIRGLGHIPFCRLRRYWNGCLSLVLLTAVPVVFYAALELSFCFSDNCHENNPVVTFWCLIFPSFNRSNIAILRACLFIHTHSQPHWLEWKWFQHDSIIWAIIFWRLQQSLWSGQAVWFNARSMHRILSSHRKIAS